MYKSLLLAGLLACFFGIFPSLASASGQVNIFIYHRFDEGSYPSTNISAEIFSKQLRYLEEHNYSVLSLGEVARRLAAGEVLPDKGAALCVDDAFRSFAEVAMPLLQEYGYPVTLFVNTDAVGTAGYLNWAELKQLQNLGVEIGNHTASHAYLIELQQDENAAEWSARINADITKAQQQLQEQLGVKAVLFAYPYGEYIPELVEIVRRFGFLAAFAQQSGVVHADSDRFVLPRFPMGGPYATIEGFVSKLQMKPLLVTGEHPFSPLVKENPPELLLQISAEGVRLGQLNCFVQGGNSCQVQAITGQDGWYKVVAEQPLKGRRNKYTLTAPGKAGGWHWYSHLWLQGENPLNRGGD